MGSWRVDVSWTGSGMRSSGETVLATVSISWIKIMGGKPYYRRIEAGVEARKPSAPPQARYRHNALGDGVFVFLSLGSKMAFRHITAYT